MIFVHRSKIPAPLVLSDPLVDEELKKLKSVSEQHLKQLRFRIHHDIYTHSMVCDKLNELFDQKCAYCETELPKDIVRNIEHYRPKQLMERSIKGMSHFHYAWMAYEWDNLMLACEECIKSKNSLFPVDSGTRAPLWASIDNCRTTEKGTIIDPCYDHPEEHFQFISSGECIALSERGHNTINLLRLNRGGLMRKRSRQWKQTEILLNKCLSDNNISDIELKALQALWAGKGEHTAVSRTVLRDYEDKLHFKELQKSSHDSYKEAVKTVSETFDAQDEEEKFFDSQEEYEKDLEDRSKKMVSPKPWNGTTEMPAFAHHRIESVEIRNFKALEEITIDFPLYSENEAENGMALLILGENSTGKSTILEAITLALLGTEQVKNLNLNLEEFITRQETEKPKLLEVHIKFEGVRDKVSLLINPKNLEIEGSQAPATVLLSYGPRRYFSKKRKHRKKGALERVRTLFDPMAVISNPKEWLMNCNEEKFNAAVRALREVLILPDEAMIARPPKGERAGGEIIFEIEGQKASISQLSEGYKTILATCVDIMRELLDFWPDLECARGVVLIDEIETHLHPRWKMRIVSSLRRCFPKVLFIATTHDPLCLRGISQGEVQVMTRNMQSGIENIYELPNVEGLSVEQLLTSPLFGLRSTEDPKFELEMINYISAASKHNINEVEESVLKVKRDSLREKIEFGILPEEKIIHKAIDSYIEQRHHNPASKQANIVKSAVDEVLNIWKNLDVNTNDEEGEQISNS